MAQLSGFGKQSALHSVRMMSAFDSFAEDDAGFAYFRSDQHHHHLAAAICRYLNEGRRLVLVNGNTDGDLIAQAINNGEQAAYRASVVQSLPAMDLGKLVRVYSAELGLGPTANGPSRRIVVQNGAAPPNTESESGGLWTLMSYLTAERQRGVTRVLLLKDSDLLDLRCFDDLQRLAVLDEQQIMPVVLLSNAADRGALVQFDVRQSPIVGRLAVDHLEQDEVGAFIRAQLSAFGNAEEMEALFPPRIMEAIAITSGGNAAVVNRLARKVFVAFSGRTQPARSPDSSLTGAENADSRDVYPATTAVPEAIAEENRIAAAADTKLGPKLGTEDAAQELTSATYSFKQPCACGGEIRSTHQQYLEIHSSPLPGVSEIATVDDNSQTGRDETLSLAPEAEEKSSETGSTAQPDETRRGLGPDRAGDETVSEHQLGLAPEITAKGVQNERLADHVGATQGSRIGGTAPQTNRPGAKLKLLAKLLAISVAAAIMLYSTGLGRRPESVPEPGGSSRREPETHVALPEAAPHQLATVTAKAPLPRLPVQSPLARPSSKPNAVVAHSTPAAGETVHQPRSTAIRPREISTASVSRSHPVAPAAVKASTQWSTHAAAGSVLPGAVLAPAPPTGDGVDAIMVQRGEQLLSAGDIISARQFFERVARNNSAAAYGLAKTYDPIFLKEIGARGISGQPATAMNWYQRAVAAGSAEATLRLRRLQAASAGNSLSVQGER